MSIQQFIVSLKNRMGFYVKSGEFERWLWYFRWC